MTENTMNTNDRRSLVASLENEVNTAGEVLLKADHDKLLAIRSDLITGDYVNSDNAAAKVNAARKRHEEVTTRLLTARDLLTESIAEDCEASDAKIREEIDTNGAKLTSLASEAHKCFLIFHTKLREAAALEMETRRLVERELNRSINGWPRIRDAREQYSNFLKAFREDTPKSPDSFAEDSANRGIANIRTAAF